MAGLLGVAGFPTHLDKKRGFDHGVFVPLKLLYPEAEIPTVQLSLLSSLDPAAHVRMGAALAPLREEGTLIVGSGMASHSMRDFMGSMGGRGGLGAALSQSKVRVFPYVLRCRRAPACLPACLPACSPPTSPTPAGI